MPVCDFELAALRSVGQIFQAVAIAMEARLDEDSDMHFDTGARIIINGVRAELDQQKREE